MIIQIEPWIDDAELDELKRVVASTFVVEHDLTREFEAMTRELTGARHAIAVCNGTMALFCCLRALGIGPGDEVLVPDLTFIATANAVILAGAKPVLVDVREDTLGIDLARAEALVGPATRAIMPVHLYGQAADMDAVAEFAIGHRLRVIEDAAQGVGVRFRGRHTGTFGDLGVLSYYGNKTITCGEGGVVLTDDDDLAREVYRLKNHGRDAKGTFIHEHIGFNFSFTEMQAAVGIAQMKKLPRIIERKARIRERYVAELAGLPGLRPVPLDERCDPVHWFTSFYSDSTDELADWLRGQGIQTRRFFYPLHLQPCYRGKSLVGNVDGAFPVSERAFGAGISLPSSHGLRDADQAEVIARVREFHADRR